MTAERFANGQANATQNRLNTPSQRATNGLITPFAPLPAQHVATRAEIPCACGCGACFVPKNNQHRYLKGHRYARFIEDKRQATFDAVWTVVWVYGNLNRELADRKAQEAVDFYFSKWVDTLVKCGWKYDTEAKKWRTS